MYLSTITNCFDYLECKKVVEIREEFKYLQVSVNKIFNNKISSNSAIIQSKRKSRISKF